MIYIIVTTSLINWNFEMREQQYKRGITSLIKRCRDSRYKIIIVENNGKRPTFLDNFGVDVVYTNNNTHTNKGINELRDVFDVVKAYSIQNDDFVVKMTGRYFIEQECPFFDEVEKGIYDCVIRYVCDRHAVTGLVGMKCCYLKTIEFPIDNTVSVEINYGKATFPIPKEKLCSLPILGVQYVSLTSFDARLH